MPKMLVIFVTVRNTLFGFVMVVVVVVCACWMLGPKIKFYKDQKPTLRVVPQASRHLSILLPQDTVSHWPRAC